MDNSRTYGSQSYALPSDGKGPCIRGLHTYMKVSLVSPLMHRAFHNVVQFPAVDAVMWVEDGQITD